MAAVTEPKQVRRCSLALGDHLDCPLRSHRQCVVDCVAYSDSGNVPDASVGSARSVPIRDSSDGSVLSVPIRNLPVGNGRRNPCFAGKRIWISFPGALRVCVLAPQLRGTQIPLL